jgi:YidC/Oxa1 family membrane protein insertase
MLNGALYSVAETGARDESSNLRFEYRDSAGLRAVKEFRLGPSAYTVTVNVTVAQNDRPIVPELVWGPGLGDRDSGTGRYAVKPGGLFSAGGKVTRLTAKDVVAQPTYERDFEYVGIEDHYFMSVVLKPGPAKVTYQPVSIPPPPGTKEPARDLMAYSITPTQPRDQPLAIYVGPKDFDTLAGIDRNLVKAINFGYFAVLVVPLLRSLNWIHGFIGNYGWSIVVLTVLINLILFPLNHKSMVSMRKMQEIQPEMKAIQDRYSKLKTTDPARQKMNQEIMTLYRERGVNPASGCVPILLTLPVFLAFYALLTTAIELRGAPFLGWIHDLSQPDAFYVMPILVGASQILTQWMTPQTGADPAQQKMMMIMPIVLIFVFVSTPAGALIYWLVGNVWRLAQQSLTNYLIGPPNVRTVRPAAERRLKRVGGGKSEGAARES